jgi:hypothetical protein
MKWILLIALTYQEPCSSPTNQDAGVALTSLVCRPPEPRLPLMQPAIRAALKVLSWVTGVAFAMLAQVAGHSHNLGGAPAGATAGAKLARWGRKGIWIQSHQGHLCLILHRAMVRNRRLATKTKVEAVRCVVALGFREGIWRMLAAGRAWSRRMAR